MFVHLVFFKMHPILDGKPAAQSADELANALNGMAGEIPQLIEVKAGRNLLGLNAHFDVGLYTTFANRTDFEAYRVHPVHQKVLELVSLSTCERSAVDFEI
ncbi:MAG: Dabb family protein [Myxococcales bacterium]|nr:Dabb family protein [Myxococcales bacterium]